MNKVIKTALTFIFVLLVTGLTPFLAGAFKTASAQTTDLTVDHTVNNGRPKPGETLNLTLKITNTSNANVNNVFMMDHFTNSAYVAGSGSAIKVSGGLTRTITLPDNWYTDTGFNAGTLTPSGTVTINYQLKVNDTAADGSYVQSQVDVRWNDMTTWGAIKEVQAKVVVPNVRMCAFKTANKTQAAPGEEIEYTITVCNDGNVVLKQILINDELPNGNNRLMTYIPGSTTLDVTNEPQRKIDDNWIGDPSKHVNIGDLNPGTRAVLKFKVRVNSNVSNGTVLENIAQVKHAETTTWQKCFNWVTVIAPVGAPQVVTAQAAEQPTLRVQKVVVWDNKEFDGVVPTNVKRFAPGDEITYRVRIENPTDQTATGVRAEDRLQEPFYLDFVKSSPPADWNASNRILTLEIGDMVAKRNITWEFVFKVRTGIPTNREIGQKNEVFLITSNAGEHRDNAVVTVFAPTAPVAAPAKPVEKPKELPRAGAETWVLGLLLSLGPAGLVLRRLRLV